MFENESRLFAFLTEYAEGLLRGVDDEQYAVQPVAGMNHPAWIVGHLAMAADLALGMLGQPTLCPPEWMAAFRPGSEPLPDLAAYPPPASLREVYRSSHRALLAAAPQADPAAMTAPHGLGIAFLERAVPTRGLLMSHLLTTHEATHIGQLSAWRRAMGLKGVMAISA